MLLLSYPFASLENNPRLPKNLPLTRQNLPSTHSQNSSAFLTVESFYPALRLFVDET